MCAIEKSWSLARVLPSATTVTGKRGPGEPTEAARPRRKVLNPTRTDAHAAHRIGWGVGTRLEIVSQAGGVLIRSVQACPETTVDDLLGLLKYDGPPKSVDEMNDAIAKGVRASKAAGT